VRDWLDTHRPGNRLPWGVVNIVSHSYEWGGLSAAVAEGQGRADAASLRLAVGSGGFVPLGDSVVDCRTDLVIAGCALGRDTGLLALLGRAFGGEDRQRPTVSSSRLFVLYESERGPGQRPRARESFAEYWYVTYPKGQRPGSRELARRLGERYPRAAIEWRGALSRTRPRFAGDAWTHTYQLPVNWLAVYPDSSSAPRFAGRRDKLEWLAGQAELGDYLSSLGLGQDDFLWSVSDTTVMDHDTLRPAVFATGRGTIVCVEREVMQLDARRPWLVRRLADSGPTRRFAATIAACEPAGPLGTNVLARL
jgi:hypothetical protein